jgi:hypothetical protein
MNSFAIQKYAHIFLLIYSYFWMTCLNTDISQLVSLNTDIL